MVLSVEPSKGGKLSISADGEFIMNVEADIWYSLDYTDGCDITEDEIEELRFLVSSRKAYAQALRFLTLRAHSADELYKKLAKKHPHDCCEFAVEKCRELGFVDDYDFARRYVNELITKKHYGLSRIRSELFSKGISGEVADEVLNGTEIDTSAGIIAVVEKKYSDCFDDAKSKNRMISGLIRLGYSYSEIKNALADYQLPDYFQD